MKIKLSIKHSIAVLIVFTTVCLLPLPGNAAQEDIVNTLHNLSLTGTGNVKATSESQVCVFCHTPHSKPGADYQAPLWNRQLSNIFYDVYQSTSLQAGPLGQPDGSSKLCLSCHDGTIALGQVNNLWGASQTIQLTGTTGGHMPIGSGESTGYTRRLGTELGNDHPVSFTYDTALAIADGELRSPPTAFVARRQPGQTDPLLPLDPFDKLQCTTCHNPHLSDPAKFLRHTLLQSSDTATEGSGAIICLQCHDKTNWIGSAHQSQVSANEIYKAGNYLGKEGAVWRHACLNCHDTHTVSGAKHLLKEGTDSVSIPKSGGNPAQEETCYLCHANSSQSVIAINNNRPPDIETEFSKNYHMPITASEQGITGESHSALDADLTETANNLGNQRHVECSDCHNPHRTGTQTHNHAVPHGNAVTSNSPLNGIWGIEPTFTGPTAFPGTGQPIASIAFHSAAPVSREYQVCMKCHSAYAYGDSPPDLKTFSGGGSYGLNEVTQSTDQAKEFNPNNASYHPVIQATGKNLSSRYIISTNPWLDPFTQVGNQTMFCTDCHGANTPPAMSAPSTGTPWGPHGSVNSFILKGQWDVADSPPNSSLLCFRCHNQSVYAGPGSSSARETGFYGSVMMGNQNLHRYHAGRLGSNFKCTLCHSAVPHGWNGNPDNPLYGTANYAKALLIERDDPQPYRTSETRLLVDSWASSGSWSFGNCRTAMQGGPLRGQTWARCASGMGGGM